MPERRTAQNELLFRRLNEQIRKLGGSSAEGVLDAVCECGDAHCFAHISIPVAAYVELRRHPRRFAIAPGHDSAERDTVIGRGQGFIVVEKRAAA